MSFKDHFSTVSKEYSRFRPSYPPELFDWLASIAPGLDLAWDAGCGNGQAALGLARHFRRVVATDASAAQIARAVPHERIAYRAAPAEESGLAAGSADLVTVAQALHWFDLEAFYAEVSRTLRPGGVFCAFAYGLLTASAPLDGILRRFYHETVGPFWPPERRHIDSGYATLPFPFAELPSPSFALEADWDFDRLLGYLGTWSAVRNFREQRAEDPLDLIGPELRQAWGDPQRERRILWPLHLRAGRV